MRSDRIDDALAAFQQHGDLERLRAELHDCEPEVTVVGLPRFSGLDLVEQLVPDDLVAIVALAVEWVYADVVTEAVGQAPAGPAYRAVAAASHVLLDRLRREIAQHLLVEPTAPLVPSLLGQVCVKCGCSDEDACVPPCSWAAPNICSSCYQPKETKGK